MAASIQWNRKPLPQSRLAPLPPGAVRPTGWLHDAVSRERTDALWPRLLRACLLDDPALLEAAQQDALARMDGEAQLTGDTIRALIAYHGITAQKEAAYCILRHAKELRDHLSAGGSLSARKAADAGDWMCACLWLYNLTGQKGLLEFCRLLKAQAPDWMSTFHVFPQTKAVEQAPDPAQDAYWRVDGRTIASALKIPGLQALFEGGRKNETAFETGWAKLARYHGAAHGLFNANPLLAGANPSCGMDSGVVEEAMYSVQTQLWTGGQAQTGDILERIAYGPAQCAGAAQAANQLVHGPGEAYAMAQFAANLWMATPDEGVAAIGYAPSTLRWRLGGQLVRIDTRTDYPAGQTIHMQIQARQPVDFTLRLRIPGWATGASVTVTGEGADIPCEAGDFCVIRRTWQPGDEVVLHLPMETTMVRRYHQSVSVERGPLTYVLPVREGEPWNLALRQSSRFEVGEASGIPVLYTEAFLVPDWTERGGVPAPPPVQPGLGEERRVTLVPYGSTTARIAQFPSAAE